MRTEYYTHRGLSDGDAQEKVCFKLRFSVGFTV